MQAAAEGRLREIFGCGTACIVQPINGLVRADGETLEAPFDASNITSMTARMTHALTDIQYARWGVPLASMHCHHPQNSHQAVAPPGP